MSKILFALTSELFKIPRYQDDQGNVNPTYAQDSYVWRVKQVIVLTALMGITGYHISVAEGWIGDGYATNNEVIEDRADGLEERIEKWSAALCMDPGDPALLEVIRGLQDEYENLVGNRYDPPPCDLLIRVR